MALPRLEYRHQPNIFIEIKELHIRPHFEK
jgi:hypothetical protein